MTYRSLGQSGLRVSAVGIGCNAFSRRADQESVNAIVVAALDTGVTLFDTADIYGVEPGASERFLGEAIRGHRDELVVATKFGMDMGGAQWDRIEAVGAFARARGRSMLDVASGGLAATAA